MTSLPSSPNAPTMNPSRRKLAWTMRARFPAGIVARTSGRRNAPMNAIPKIITGNMAKERLPNIVECIRHSSLTMAMNSSNMVSLPDKLEEELREVLAPAGQFGNRAGVEQFPFMQDGKLRADLFGHLEDVRGDEDGVALPGIACKVILDQVLHDRVEIGERFIDQGKGGLVDEGLGKHQFLP